MSVVPDALLKDLQKQVALVAEDLRQQVERVPEIGMRLRAMHRAAGEIGRTGETWNDWLTTQSEQAASSWVVACAFIRFCEDNDLTAHRWIASRDADGNATSEAADAEAAWIQRNPRLTAREWLREAFTWLRSTQAGHALFPQTDFVWWWQISADMAEVLIDAFRRRDDEGVRLAHDFHSADLDTRFLGDLYQDLSEHVRKRYALLQTPGFVEEFILDITLNPALDDFGLEGFKLIDPTCGSGHFLLGAFRRLLEEWVKQAPGLDERVRVQRVLDSIHGVDINPTATAITKFRLMVAALKACGVARLDAPEVPALNLNIATGDSLLYGGGRLGGGRQTSIPVGESDGLAYHLYDWEDVDQFPGILDYGRYHVVVGNPPYIQVADKSISKAYKRRFSSCYREYAMTVPFAELFFRLAVKGVEIPGYVGQITSNSFMKREFGRRLIEDFFAYKVEVTHIVDTSGIRVADHGTPTVIVLGRNRDRRRQSTIRAVLGIRADPPGEKNPAEGPVWKSIVAYLDRPGEGNQYISVVDLSRERLNTYPWSLSGGGAAELMECIQAACSRRLEAVAEEIGLVVVTGEDSAFVVERNHAMRQRGLMLQVGAEGADIRDWHLERPVWLLSAYDEEWNLQAPEQIEPMLRFLWPLRECLFLRKRFSVTLRERGCAWYEWRELYPSKIKAARLIAFPLVSTHNHFYLLRSPMALKHSAPVIKLMSQFGEDDHLGLLGLLNSSVACFWLKQVCHDKGGGGIGGGVAAESWERFYEVGGSKLRDFPLPDGAPLKRAKRLHSLAQQLSSVTPRAVCEKVVPSRQLLMEARRRYEAIRAEMIAVQEELDWEVYTLYGILDENLAYDGDDLPGLTLGQRAFEIALGRKLLDGETDTQWFARHGSTPIRDLPDEWPQAYRELVRRRIEALESKPLLNLVETPECKRRWSAEPYEQMQAETLRTWLLERLEDERLWFDSGSPRTLSVAQLTDLVRTDTDFRQVMDLYLGRPDYDITAEVIALLKDEHVPYLAAYRYTSSGLIKRKDWEAVWDKQRREDAGEKVEIQVPQKYGPKDFARQSYWRHRGKLDVPKERFISYPNAERDGDATPVYGWAGWDHLQQATALANLLIERGYPQGDPRVVPLLAGIAELEPWLHQWHNEYDPLYAASPAEYFTGWLETQLAEHGLTRDKLAAWRPEAKPRGRRAKKGA